MTNVVLNEAYVKALERLSFAEGVGKAMVVRSVIYSRECMKILEKEISPPLAKITVEAFADVVGTMCTVLDMKFNEDILPLVRQVDEEVKDYLWKNLQ